FEPGGCVASLSERGIVCVWVPPLMLPLKRYCRTESYAELDRIESQGHWSACDKPLRQHETASYANVGRAVKQCARHFSFARDPVSIALLTREYNIAEGRRSRYGCGERLWRGRSAENEQRRVHDLSVAQADRSKSGSHRIPPLLDPRS